MKQFDKLRELLRDPLKYGVKKNTRVYRFIEEIAVHGVAQTGFSSRRTKYVDTYCVSCALQRAGVSCKSYNDAPRGGACGEHVALTGKVYKDVAKGLKAFTEICKLSGDKRYRYPWNIEGDYLKTLKQN